MRQVPGKEIGLNDRERAGESEELGEYERINIWIKEISFNLI